MEELDMIAEVRGFNRFYTDILGLLNQHILDSDYSLTEARVLFEVNESRGCTANQLCSMLKIDKSYMSRIIRNFEKDGLIERKVAPEDNRNMLIAMTENGRNVLHELNGRSDGQIRELLSDLGEEEREELLKAIRTVKKYFKAVEKI